MPAPQSTRHCCLHGAICPVLEHHDWIEPLEGREWAVKAALKAHRDIARFAINTQEPDSTGVEVSEPFLFVCAVAQAVDALEVYQQRVVKLYYLGEFGKHQDEATGQWKRCQATNEEVGQLMGGFSSRQIGRWKAQAIRQIKARIYGSDEDADNEGNE